MLAAARATWRLAARMTSASCEASYDFSAPDRARRVLACCEAHGTAAHEDTCGASAPTCVGFSRELGRARAPAGAGAAWSASASATALGSAAEDAITAR